MIPWLVTPVILPAATAAVMLLVARGNLVVQRVLSLASAAGLLGLALSLATRALPRAEALGNWPAPFGIVLVADGLTALMLALVAVLAAVVLLHVLANGVDRLGASFHPLFQFQLMGLNGAFLTGDAFTLFVFFEVLLIASYGLVVHGGGAERLSAGLRYVVTNLVGSTLFLIGLGVVYATTGTLNMADLAVKVAALPAGDFALIRVAAVMLLMVFAVKAALVPLHVWLPGTYAAAPATVAALFAVMTKVGAYAALRFGTLIFPPGTAATDTLYADLLLPAGLVTLAVGSIGMLGARGLNGVAAHAAITSTGTLFVALSAFTPEATAAGLYYLVHSTLAVAALFLLADIVSHRGGRSGPVAVLFFAVAIGVAGLPPLSGFLGKLLILQARWQDAALVWPVVLVTSLVAMVGLSRLGSDLFWKGANPDPAPRATLTAPAVVLAVLLGLTVCAGPVLDGMTAVAGALHNPAAYLATVEALQ